MLLVEERLFPGDELAAAMTAGSGGGIGGSGSGGGDAAVGRKSAQEAEGGWGEDGTAAGSLSHLVDCMLEVRRGGWGDHALHARGLQDHRASHSCDAGTDHIGF